MAQWVKDLALSLLWLMSLLSCGFNPWPGKFCMIYAQPKRKERKEKKIQNLRPLPVLLSQNLHFDPQGI